MKRARRLGGILCLALSLVVLRATASDEERPAGLLGESTGLGRKPLVQIAILLDTSGSMNGLLEQAKTQLWKIVNEFITAKRKGQRPEVQVALFQYGSGSIPAAQGYLRRIVPLTTDLDKVSEELFKLSIGGSEEYCGLAIQAATSDLAWSTSNDDLKTIFIAGNEPFTQGKVDYKGACRAAIAKGILVNTIYCGAYQEGVNGQWEDGAKLADGKYLNIEQNRQAVHIEAPQDREIQELGGKLNSTYIAFGGRGEESKSRQGAQDQAAAAAAPAAAVERAVAKGSANYRAESWDLVDAVKEKKADLATLKKEELPKEMENLSEADRKAFVETKSKERAEIQAQIQKLNEERRKFVAEEMKKRAEKGADSLEGAMLKAIREQAEKKAFKFE